MKIKHYLIFVSFLFSFIIFMPSLSHARTMTSKDEVARGDNYYYGRNGVKQDYAKAAYWFQKSAAQGDAAAQAWLGYIYKAGQGVPLDYSQAAYWYQKSANQGYSYAENNLGVLYYNGQGVPKDYSLAVYWLKKAVAQGDAAARQNLNVITQQH